LTCCLVLSNFAKYILQIQSHIPCFYSHQESMCSAVWRDILEQLLDPSNYAKIHIHAHNPVSNTHICLLKKIKNRWKDVKVKRQKFQDMNKTSWMIRFWSLGQWFSISSNQFHFLGWFSFRISLMQVRLWYIGNWQLRIECWHDIQKLEINPISFIIYWEQM
jgi:hypothetical protein